MKPPSVARLHELIRVIVRGAERFAFEKQEQARTWVLLDKEEGFVKTHFRWRRVSTAASAIGVEDQSLWKIHAASSLGGYAPPTIDTAIQTGHDASMRAPGLVSGARALTRELDRVPAIEQAAGPSPAWYQPST